ncbi:MAG: hypothetical protein WC994_00725 [Brumimicrobium sp.]
MRYPLIFLFTTLVLASCTLPKPTMENFEGKFVYYIESDSEFYQLNKKDSSSYQIVYAKDSMLRIENFTPIGKQVYVKHIPRNKAYILMDVGEKIAIQTIPDTIVDDGYSFERKSGKVEIAGIMANNISVIDHELDTTITMNYYPKISPKYSSALNNMPGLPVKYKLFVDNSWLTYTLISLEEKEIDINMFGIPSDYTIITFDEFIEHIEKGEEE